MLAHPPTEIHAGRMIASALTPKVATVEGMPMGARWDPGEMGCGQLVFELRGRLSRLKPGERLEVVARDPGAPVDLPAWCRMTGHSLVSADPPVFVIQRRAD